MFKKEVRKFSALCLSVLLSVGIVCAPADVNVTAAGSSFPEQSVSTQNLTGTDDVPLPKYMIIADDSMYSQSQLIGSFVEWKKMKGNNVTVVKTSQTGSSFSSVTSYLRSLPDSEYPEYILILGDQLAVAGEQVRFRDYVKKLTYTSYTDRAFSLRDTNDSLPDSMLGRLPASNAAELDEMLNKVMKMDKTPPTSNMYDNVLTAGQANDGDYFGETADAVASYFEHNTGYNSIKAITNDLDSKTTWESGLLWGDNSPISPGTIASFVDKNGIEGFNRIKRSIQGGQYSGDSINYEDGTALIQYVDHGSTDRWEHPGFTSSDVSSLTNGDNTPLVISSACSTGEYDETNSFVKSWLTNPNGGAYAFIGASIPVLIDDLCWFTHGLHMSFLPYRSWINGSTDPNYTNDLPAPQYMSDMEGNCTRLGQMFNFGIKYMIQTRTSTMNPMQLFGDPEGTIQFHAPSDMNVQFQYEQPLSQDSITINTGEEDCDVCLYMPGTGGSDKIHMLKKTGSSGSVTFDISEVKTPGDVNVTVTKYGRRPYLGTVTIFNTRKISGYIKPDLDSTFYGINTGCQVSIPGLDIYDYTSTSGYFELNDVPASTTPYTLVLTRPRYITRNIENVLVDNSDIIIRTQSDPILLYAGDANSDGVLSMDDTMILSTYFNQSAYHAPQMMYDLNRDYIIDSKDIDIINKHIGATTASYPSIY